MHVHIVAHKSRAQGAFHESLNSHVCEPISSDKNGGCVCCECNTNGMNKDLRSMGGEFTWTSPPYLNGDGTKFKLRSLHDCEQACLKDDQCLAGK